MKAYERLLGYTQYPTASDENSPTCPSTPSQLVLAKDLVEEMKGLGMADARMDENGYVYGTIPANIPDWDGITIGFIAHMDVVDVVPYTDIKPRLVKDYDGGTIVLNEEKQITMGPDEYPELANYKGKTLVVTDGTTLLGADDKAGIADILTMAEYFQTHPEVLHGTIKVGFTPDEEIGRGADLFDVPGFKADFAYTIDGGAFGEVEYETFNAASAKLTFTGKSIHPGSAKNKMKHAGRIAMEFDSLLPAQMRPEYTEGREGFFHLTDMSGTEEKASLSYILRDHDLDKLAWEKKMVQAACDFINAKYGEGTVQAEIKDSYYNMVEQLKPHWHLIDIAGEEIRALGGEPVSMPVRGGTDGSRLSYMGLPCPNLGTGGHNCHGRFEYACVEEMEQCTELLVRIALRYAKQPK